MAAVYLTKLWLHDAADLSSSIELRLGDEGENDTENVTVRMYANGVVRSVSTPGRLTEVPFTLFRVARTDYLALLARIGRLQMLRTPRGRKLWGVLGAVSASERRPINELSQVTFTFREVTVHEGV